MADSHSWTTVLKFKFIKFLIFGVLFQLKLTVERLPNHLVYINKPFTRLQGDRPHGWLSQVHELYS